MSIKSSIEKLTREIAYKKLIVLDGNVLDVYFHKWKFLSLNEYLPGKIKESAFFDDVYVWDRIDGLVFGDITRIETPQAALEKGNEIEDLAESLFDNSCTSEIGQFKKPTDFYPIMYRNIKNGKRKVAFILNFSNYLFPNEQGLSDDDRENLTRITKCILEQNIDLKDKSYGSAIILVTNNISSIPVSLYQNNPDARVISLSKPDREERKEIIEAVTNFYCLNEKLETDESGKTDLIDALDNFTVKEILQTVILSKNQEEFLNIEKLLSLYKYGKKESPWEKLDANKVKEIEKILSKRVKGQDGAIAKVKDVVIRAKTGLSGLQHSKMKSKPKGALFFAGPTGVGKTELAKSLAEFLFGDENSCIRFDMSEYNHEHSDQKLIGAPPGYVGYESGGQLTNLIKEKPFCVLLFDEIEKAHPKILDKFLQILEDGRLTDNKGETVYFSECIIVFTSNIGANKVNPTMTFAELKQTIFDAIKEKFETEINRPELLGRIGYGNIITFNFITDIDISKKIASAKLEPVITFLAETKKIKLEFRNKDEFLNYVIGQVDKSKGGRDILNKLEDVLITKLAAYLFENEGYIYPDSTLNVEFNKKNNEISFSI